MKINPKKLKDEELLAYFAHYCEDEELTSLALLVPYAMSDKSDKERNDVLRKVVNGAELKAVYEDIKAPKGAIFLGSIMDGSLYLIP